MGRGFWFGGQIHLGRSESVCFVAAILFESACFLCGLAAVFKTRIVPFSLLAIILTAAPIIVCLPKKLFKHPAVYAPLLLFSMPNWGRWESLILMAWVVSAATLEKGETGKNPPLLLFLPAFFALYPYTDFIFDMKSIVLFEPLPIFVLIALCLIYNASNVFKGAWQWITFKASDS